MAESSVAHKEQGLHPPLEPAFTWEIQLWDRHFSTSPVFKIYMSHTTLEKWNHRTMKVGKDLQDCWVQLVTDSHLVTQTRGLSATSHPSLKTSRDGVSKPPWAAPSNA